MAALLSQALTACLFKAFSQDIDILGKFDSLFTMGKLPGGSFQVMSATEFQQSQLLTLSCYTGCKTLEMQNKGQIYTGPWPAKLLCLPLQQDNKGVSIFLTYSELIWASLCFKPAVMSYWKL